MNKEGLKIGLALSGGGIRAIVFHLGVLKWMAENSLLERVVRVSTVSGGSLCIGLVYSHNSQMWPSSSDFLVKILPQIKETLLRYDIQNISLIRLITSPKYWNRKVNLLAHTLQKYWRISGKISDLGKKPLWYINCTTFETGKRFRFSQENMGDYQLGYVENPDIPLVDAVTASAGFPVLIGPYVLDTEKYYWKKLDSQYNGPLFMGGCIHLWDGGVYDNLGLESVYKMDQSGCLSDGLNYLIVSNASGSSGYRKRGFSLSSRNLFRLLEIAMDQVGALRNRSVMDYIKRTKKGIYFKIGNSAEYIIAQASNTSDTKHDFLVSQCLDSSRVRELQNYPTTLSKPSELQFDLLLRHGYEVAKCTYTCYADSLK